MHNHTNRLAGETSPYLLQHAHNPVDWYPWGDEALQRAIAENKPILVSIGYAACHWCHVMERESFEDETVAAMMNENFVNIKIDREERPDLDHIYMDAVQAMTGSGGWPLNVFLTPDARPFYGGTYFPPKRAFNRASWPEVLQGVTQAFNDRRNEIDQQAEQLTKHLLQSNSFGQQSGSSEEIFNIENIDEAADQVMKAADKEEGGFGNAPKFPQTFTIAFLLRYHYVSRFKNLNDGDRSLPEDGLKQALLSLDKMINGGINDQLGGGFARYSTDAEWLAPHFEKMLYDNALLLGVIAEAYQVTGNERYREVIDETMNFIKRELMHEQGGFYSALDADSEGVEGKFYVWNKIEVEKCLSNASMNDDDVKLFCSYYDITNQGNWEGENILRVKTPVSEFAQNSGVSVNHLKSLLEAGRNAMMKERNKRVRPLLDDKIILGWNALMNTACSKVYQATGIKAYKELAIANMKFLLSKFADKGPGGLHHTWKDEQAKFPAFLDDYAFLVQALIGLYEITAEPGWLLEARRVAEFVVGNFSEEGSGYFYFTHKDQKDVIVRKREVYDGAVPSGNSVMAGNLYRLSIFFDLADWRERSLQMVSSLGKTISRHPTSFGVWASFLLEILSGTEEIAVVGKDAGDLHQEIIKEFIPFKVLMASKEADKTFPLLDGKEATDPASIYLCKDFVCLRPVDTVNDLMSLINNRSRNK